jgi:DNA-binding Lrp family transcriptional regulator
MTTAFVMMNAEVGSEDELARELKKLGNVREVHPVYGVYDIVVKVEAETMDQLKEVILRIRKLDKIRSTLTMTVMEGTKS